MSTRTEKQKNFNGMSSSQARAKLQEIMASEDPGIDLIALSKQFEASHKITLLGVCEIWHQLRSKNYAVEAMIHSFADTLARRNKEKTLLAKRIHDQRERIAFLEKLVIENERSEVSGPGPKRTLPEVSEV